METTSMPIEFLVIPIVPFIAFFALIIFFNLFFAYVIIDKTNSGFDDDSTWATVAFMLWAIHEFTFSAFILLTSSYELFFINISLSLIFFLAPIAVFFLRHRKSKRSNGR